ncbi:MAG: glycosyltransferase [Pseudomonadota bacterium]
MRVAFLVCHLTGTGHLARTLALARAVAAAGGRPLVLSGGRALAHHDWEGTAFHPLPPLRVDGFDYATLRRMDGAVAPPLYLEERRRQIVEALARFEPDVLVTETFPLGRRRLAAEFEAAIDAVQAIRPQARILASVRDIPEPPSRPERLVEATQRIIARFDRILVHGEADLVPLSASWPLPPEAAARVGHTGYIGRSDLRPARRGDEVLVSVGGGVLGRRLLGVAVEAAGLVDRPWCLLVGGPDAASVAACLAEAAPPNLVAEPARPDYPDLLAAAACSVSLAGYNTVMDLAACRTPAVIVPFAEHGEREQSLRAEALAALPGLSVLSGATLTAASLAQAVSAAACAPDRPAWPFARDGARRAALAILEEPRDP